MGGGGLALWPAAVALLAATAGCPPRPAPAPFDPLPSEAAIRIVNDNLGRIPTTLNARGRVRGYVTLEGGARRHFNLASHLFYLQPRYLSLDLKDDLAGSQLLFGSNDDHYWYYNKADSDSYWCRRHDRLVEGRDPDIPVRPDDLIEALGLTMVDLSPSPARSLRVQRIESQDQQLLFVTCDAEGRPFLEKEYWLSRLPPQLISRVVYRDAMGRVVMESSLSDYRPLEDGGPLLPGSIEVDWPLGEAHMTFTISRWRAIPQVKAAGPQFTPPHRRGERFEHEFIDE